MKSVAHNYEHWPNGCTVCNEESVVLMGQAGFYRNPKMKGFLYSCCSCGARVGCHPGTTNPLGALANEETRESRSLAHAMLDPIWHFKWSVMEQTKEESRQGAYKFMSELIDVPPERAHIAELNDFECRRLSRLLGEVYNKSVTLYRYFLYYHGFLFVGKAPKDIPVIDADRYLNMMCSLYSPNRHYLVHVVRDGVTPRRAVAFKLDDLTCSHWNGFYHKKVEVHIVPDATIEGDQFKGEVLPPGLDYDFLMNFFKSRCRINLP